MKKCLTIFCITIIHLIPSAFSQTVSLHFDKTSQQQLYGASALETALIKKGYKIKNASAFYHVDLAINAKQLGAGSGAESFSIKRAKQTITITGGDDRGLIYGCLSLAEDIRNGIALKDCRTKNEKPLLTFRAIKYDLPWDTYRHSYALELHDQTCRDTAYWKAFLDMMAENRFNSLTLWNLHPYTFLIKPKNFPEASPWNDKEMKEWQTLFHSIIRMAEERAIETYIVPFNIFVTPEFAKAHNVAMHNLTHDYFVNGDTSEIIKRYTRECVTQMLEEYPGLTGMGLTLGEGMGGMTPQQREDWMTATIIEGMRLANRKSKLIHRIPFSSTTGSAGVTSIETEKLTRKEIEKEAAMGFIEGSIWADLKFNWSHAHSTTKLIKVHGGKLYDTYFKPEPSAYKIVWTARNEDFFCLRWGVPSFVRNHILQNTRSYSGGYIIGSETYIPAKDYFTRDSIDLPWRYAFERQWLFYKLWGRLMYDPTATDELFKKEFTRRYGNSGEQLLAASALGGNTPLRLASFFDCSWDFTLYSEGMMALDDATKRVDYISVDRLIKQPPLDTSYVSVADYVERYEHRYRVKPGMTAPLVAPDSIRNSGPVVFDKKEITPPMLAAMLEKDCNAALKLVSNVRPGSSPSGQRARRDPGRNNTTGSPSEDPVETPGNKALRYEVADIKAWSYLGLHLAEKIKGAVALQTYRTRGGDTNKEKAIKYLQKALTYWDSVISITRPLYKDMPLVHLSQQGGKESKENFYLSFHWEKLRGDVARDVEIAQQAVGGK